MLRARSGAGKRKSCAKGQQSAGTSSQYVAQRGETRADGKDRAATQPLGDPHGGDLQSCHDPGVDATQQRQRGVSEAELPLPDRQQDVDQVGEAIVQSMSDPGDQKRASRTAARRDLDTCSDLHTRGRHPTSPVLFGSQDVPLARAAQPR